MLPSLDLCDIPVQSLIKQFDQHLQCLQATNSSMASLGGQNGPCETSTDDPSLKKQGTR